MSDSPSDEQKPNREGDRPQRDGQRRDSSRPTGGRPQGSRPQGSRPSTGSDRGRPAQDRKPSDAKGGQPWKRDGKPSGAPRDNHGTRDGARDKKLWTREGKPARGDRDARDHERALTEEERLARELRSVRPRHEDPEIPETVQARDLDKVARAELKTLSKDNADQVARHLVMAARLIEDDPELAHQHALSAARRAGRVAVVRETLAITAYATGDFGLALRELRTFRRISGSNDQLPLMVDSERGVGRPDRALELGRSVDRATLPTDVQVSLAIAMSGARLDLGQNDEALAELEIPQLDPNRAYSWSPELFHAYGDVLDELGREEEASTWRERAARAEQAIGGAQATGDEETVDVFEEEIEQDDGETIIEFEGDEGDEGDVEIIEGEDDSAVDDATAEEAEIEDEVESHGEAEIEGEVESHGEADFAGEAEIEGEAEFAGEADTAGENGHDGDLPTAN